MHRFRIRTPSGAATFACLIAVASACGDDASAVPPGCTGGRDPLLAALRAAPEPVRVDGARLSECLSAESGGDQVQLVGAGFVDAAATLSTRARREPEGPAALQLGYLVAAAHRGGDRTQGVHYELLRRLDQEAAPFRGSRAYRRGASAARTAG